MPPDIVKARGESNIVWNFARLVEDGVVSQEKLVTLLGDENGSLHVRLYGPDGEAILAASDTPDMAAQAPAAFNVTPASVLIVAANPNRKALSLVNISDTAISLGLDGHAAALNAGITLVSGGGTVTLSRWGSIFTTGEVRARHTGVGNKIITIQEFE